MLKPKAKVNQKKTEDTLLNDVLFRMADVFNSQEMKDHWLKYN